MELKSEKLYSIGRWSWYYGGYMEEMSGIVLMRHLLERMIEVAKILKEEELIFSSKIQLDDWTENETNKNKREKFKIDKLTTTSPTVLDEARQFFDTHVATVNGKKGKSPELEIYPEEIRCRGFGYIKNIKNETIEIRELISLTAFWSLEYYLTLEVHCDIFLPKPIKILSEEVKYNAPNPEVHAALFDVNATRLARCIEKINQIEDFELVTDYGYIDRHTINRGLYLENIY
jgi:hypothetical protein